MWAAAGVVVLMAVSAAPAGGPAARTWLVYLEEPTGIEARDAEVVSAPLGFEPGEVRDGSLRVISPGGDEVVSQVVAVERYADGSLKRADVLFQATLRPGERPTYMVVAQPDAGPAADAAPHEGTKGGGYPTDLVIRRISTSRLEIGNGRFGAIIDLGIHGTVAAIVEAYNRAAGTQRVVNLVETTPDQQEPLAIGVRSAGWSTALDGAQRTSGFSTVDILEPGPLRARVRLSGSLLGGVPESWEFEWTAGSPVLTWRINRAAVAARYGFVISSLSASPYLPFTRWIDGSESAWPSGPDTADPPDHPVTGTALDDLPGSQVVYYDREQDYGALAFIETDRSLRWDGIGGNQFTATTAATGGAVRSSIGLGFTRWRGTETVLEARHDCRRFLFPVIAQTGSPVRAEEVPSFTPAPRQATYQWREEPLVDEALPPDPARLSLDGRWLLRDAAKGEGERLGWFREAVDDEGWRPATVPGTAHVQVLGLEASFTTDANWVSTREWWYRRHLQVPPEFPLRHARLRFGATDYYADVWVNGVRAGYHEGYVDPWEIDVSGLLRPGADNVIAVRTWTPVSYYWRHRPYTIKGAYGAVDQKPDDITAVGITRPVALIAYGPVRLDDVAVRTSLNGDGSADVDVDVMLSGDTDEDATLELVLAPHNFKAATRWRATVSLAQPEILARGSVSVRFHLEQPALWWTRDHGVPNLYSLSTRITAGGEVSDARTERVGIREIERVGWVFYLNGRRLFIRGTNSYYFGLFLSEVTREQYARDLALIAGMNVNMIRLHCHFQNPEFYDLADEMGLLVWQDYLEAWYPHDPAFALHAARLYDAHVRMVRNHPCIATWATSDEEDLENYRVLTKHLAARLFLLDPQRRAVVRSTGRFGDAHVYEGWYGGSIWEYTKSTEAFISELGATALPSYGSLMKFLPNHWPIEAHRDDWIFHKLQIGEAMRAWGPPGDTPLAEYIPRTQAYVARLHQLAIERMRRRKYDAGGILHFHAIDFWPSVTMAAVDYYRVPTLSYDVVRRSFQPVLASVVYDRDTYPAGDPLDLSLWVVNDNWDGVPGAVVTWRVLGASGRVVAEGRVAVAVAADSSAEIGRIRWTPRDAGPVTIVTEVRDRGGARLSENRYDLTIAAP